MQVLNIVKGRKHKPNCFIQAPFCDPWDSFFVYEIVPDKIRLGDIREAENWDIEFWGPYIGSYSS